MKKEHIEAVACKTIFNIPRQWYTNYFCFKLELLTAFINISNKEIKDSKFKYSLNKEIIEFHDINGEVNFVELYENIDNQTFLLNEIFIEYFPDLRHKSNFTLIISCLEDGLRELCKELGQELSINFKPKNPKGFLEAVSVFLKSIKLNYDIDGDENWLNLKTAYLIRNKIVHLTDKDIIKSKLKVFNISEDFVFSQDTNSLLLDKIHSFLKKLEKHLLKI